MKKRTYFQKGGFLIEAVIAMILLGVGMLALMQLQGKLTSGISVSKARSEATQFIQRRSQWMRTHVASGQLIDQPWGVCDPPPPEDPGGVIPGVNASFTEECRIVDATDPAGGDYKEAMVRISWIDESGSPQSVSLNNFVTFSSPGVIGLLDEDEITNSPLNRRQRWAEEKVEDGTEGDERPTNANEISGLPSGIELFKRTNSLGHWEIYNGSGTVVLTAYGGILHEISGTVYFQGTNMNANDVDELEILATSPSYCETQLCSKGTDPDCLTSDADKNISYVCWIPGDCSYEGSFSDDQTSANYACQFGLDSTDNTIKKLSGLELDRHINDIEALELAGGWYGRVGVFGVQENPFDDIVTGDSCDSPSRNYVAHRLSIDPLLFSVPLTPPGCNDAATPELVKVDPGYIYDINDKDEITALVNGYCITNPYAIYTNEGINTPYSEHQNFWLVDKAIRDVNCPTNVQDACDASVGLAPSNMVRPIIDNAATGAPPPTIRTADPSDGFNSLFCTPTP